MAGRLHNTHPLTPRRIDSAQKKQGDVLREEGAAPGCKDTLTTDLHY